jgi:hypothetical protein
MSRGDFVQFEGLKGVAHAFAHVGTFVLLIDTVSTDLFWGIGQHCDSLINYIHSLIP